MTVPPLSVGEGFWTIVQSSVPSRFGASKLQTEGILKQQIQGRCGLGALLMADRVLLEDVWPRLRLRYSGSRVRLRER